jgi:hypothetical protein
MIDVDHRKVCLSIGLQPLRLTREMGKWNGKKSVTGIFFEKLEQS